MAGGHAGDRPGGQRRGRLALPTLGRGHDISNGAELAEKLRLVMTDRVPEMAVAGRRYVIENYTWPPVLDRMEASLKAL